MAGFLKKLFTCDYPYAIIDTSNKGHIKMNKHIFKENYRAMILEVTDRKKTYASLTLAMVLLSWTVTSGIASIMAKDTSAAETANSSFQVNVMDTLAVAVTTPEAGAAGNANEFLRNTIDVEVNTNASNGFTASMYSRNNTDLVNTAIGISSLIPTMSSSALRSAFPTNVWGYSLKSSSLDGKTYGETDAGNNGSTYYPLTDSTSAPIKILTAASGAKSGAQSVYFGTKVNTEKPAGTYLNTVVISVVTGVIDSGTNPITPVNPANPSTDPNPNDTVPVYTGNNDTTGTGISGSNGTTVRTVRTTNSGTPATTTTTTEISAGDNTSSYAPAQGVSISTQSNIVENGSTLPIGLAATSVATATAGVIFFILAKRDEDDEEEEEDLI